MRKTRVDSRSRAPVRRPTSRVSTPMTTDSETGAGRSAADFIPPREPTAAEVRACHPWLEAEIRLIHPKVIVALGATAAQALMGNKFKVTEQRGRPVPSAWAEVVFATVHPSAVLRAPADARERARREFFADLAQVGRHLEGVNR